MAITITIKYNDLISTSHTHNCHCLPTAQRKLAPIVPPIDRRAHTYTIIIVDHKGSAKLSLSTNRILQFCKNPI